MKSIRVLFVLILVVGGLYLVPSASARTQLFGGDGALGSAASGEEHRFWLRWTPALNISKSAALEAIWPAIRVTSDGQGVYLAWSDGRDDPANIYYAFSSNGGDTWGSPLRAIQTSLVSLRPSIAVSGLTFFVAWADAGSGLQHTNRQMTLGTSSSVLVPNDYPELASASRLAATSSGELHLVLQGSDGVSGLNILYARRAAGTASWPKATVVVANAAEGLRNPDLAVSTDGQKVHLVWQENQSAAESKIYYMQGQRSGQNVQWKTPVSLSEGIVTSVRPAIILGSGGMIHVAWGEVMPGIRTQYVRYSRSTDGTSWSAPVRIDDEPVNAHTLSPTDIAPALGIVPAGNICVAWHGYRSGVSIQAEEVYLTCSDKAGANWDSPVNVSQSSHTISIRPVLATGNDGILHLAWQEYVGPSAANNYQIYYAHSVPYSVYLPTVYTH